MLNKLLLLFNCILLSPLPSFQQQLLNLYDDYEDEMIALDELRRETEEASSPEMKELLSKMREAGLTPDDETSIMDGLYAGSITMEEVSRKLDYALVERKWRSFAEEPDDRGLSGSDLDQKKMADLAFCKKFAEEGIQDMIAKAELDFAKHNKSYIGYVEAELESMCFKLKTRKTSKLLIPRRDYVCYPVYGCFGERMPHIDQKAQAPSHISPSYVIIHKTLPRITINEPQDNSPDFDKFIIDRKPKQLAFLLHGFNSNIDDWTDTIYYEIADAMAATTMYKHVVIMKYLKAVSGTFSYTQAMANSELIGIMLGRTVHQMIRTAAKHKIELNHNGIYFVGFSMGCQVAHFAAEYLKYQGIKIHRITALDPARVLTLEVPNIQVNMTDAFFVDVIHTSADDMEIGWLGWGPSVNTVIGKGRVGILQPLGHIDFYPNGGGWQPVCGARKTRGIIGDIRYYDPFGGILKLFICHHEAALKYYLRSFDTEINCRYDSYPCFLLRNPDEYPVNACDVPFKKDISEVWEQKAQMGFQARRYFGKAYPVQLLFTSKDEVKQCETNYPCIENRCANIIFGVLPGALANANTSFVWPVCYGRWNC